VDYDVKAEDRERVEAFLKELRVDEPVTASEVDAMLNFTIGDRGSTLYLIWKALEREYPEVDAVELLRKVSWDRGIRPTKQWGDIRTPEEWVKKAFDRTTVISCKLEFPEMNERRAQVVFRRCPHMDAVRAMRVPPEDVRTLCKDIMIACDFARVEPYPHLKVSFPEGTCGDGEDCHCLLVIEAVDEAE
jgi:hypothetical protein